MHFLHIQYNIKCKATVLELLERHTGLIRACIMLILKVFCIVYCKWKYFSNYIPR